MKSSRTQSDLYTVPNLGPRSIEHLEKIGITSIAHLEKYGPEKIYNTLCAYYKKPMHMAFLYVLRAGSAYVRGSINREGALQWWMFRSPKDKELVSYYKQKYKTSHGTSKKRK